MIYPSVWTETLLNEHGYKYESRFTCKTCGEEVSVYEKSNNLKKLFLQADGTLHPFHRREDE
jgi:transcription initiation factor IIE alpha subunit